MNRSARRARITIVLATVAAFSGWACTDDNEEAAGPAAGADASTTTPTDEGGAPSTAPDAGSSSDAASVGDAAPAGITVDVDGTTHELTLNARASQMGNGYSVQAGKVDGAKLYGVTIQLVKAESDGGVQYVLPTPGTYGCSATVPSAPYLWARIQYTSPEGTFQYGSGATCVTLASFGGVGQPVKGSFASTLERATNTGPATVQVSGTFDVDRVN